MKNKTYLLTAWIFIFSFLLNYLWESVHAVFLYKEHNIVASQYIPMLFYVSSIDALFVLFSYLIVALICRKYFWLNKITRFNCSYFILINVLIALVIEIRSVFYLSRWKYNSYMPLFLGIGISPLIQLAATGIFAVWLTKKVIN